MEKQKVEILFGGEAREDIVRFAKSNKVLSLLLISQMIITITALLFTFNTWMDRVVVKISLPNGVLTVAPNRASESFYDMWGRYIIQKVSNFAPSTIQQIAYDINQKIDPESYVTMSEELKGFSQGVYYGGYSQTFNATKYTTNMDESGRSAVVRGYGRAKRITATGQIVFDKECEYGVSLILREGEVYVTGMSTSCK